MATESVLASMFSPPTLNVVVLGMTFALFPLPIALLKLGTVLLMLFVFAPLIGAKFSRPEAQLACPVDIPVSETWGQAVIAAAKSYGRNFWYITKVGIPLMLMAALLGALAVEIVPQTALTSPVKMAFPTPAAVLGTRPSAAVPLDPDSLPVRPLSFISSILKRSMQEIVVASFLGSLFR